MNLRQNLLQKVTLSQSLQQSLYLLSLSNEDLAEAIQQESLENPLLEIEQAPSFQFYDSLEAPSNQPYSQKAGETLSQDRLLEPESLKAFLLKQKDQSFYSQEIKGLIEILISYLDEKGYLRVNPEELAVKNKIASPKIKTALKALQSFEPLGVGARNLEECLLIQMRQKNIQEPHLKKLISYHLELVKDRKYPYIARELGVNLEEVKRLVDLLKTLQPNPAFNFSYEPTVFVKPDLYIYEQGDSFSVLFNKDSLPQLRLSSFYTNRLAKKNLMTEEERKYLQGKKKAANFFIHALLQREERIKKVAFFIIKHQEPFFRGGISFLKPLKMLDLAKELRIHVSTVSRTISNKYAYTPYGMIALRDFFIPAVQSSFIDSPSTKKIKACLKKWVEKENPLKPLTDEELKTRVEERFNLYLTRRRIAQYRSEIRIPQGRIRRLNFLYADKS